jgi:hypothetical protein
MYDHREGSFTRSMLLFKVNVIDGVEMRFFSFCFCCVMLSMFLTKGTSVAQNPGPVTADADYPADVDQQDNAQGPVARMLLAPFDFANPPAWSTPPVPARSIDNIVGFSILVWQYKTNAVQDANLYDQANLRAWHIDRGQGREADVKFAKARRWPYYVDHAAGKGVLHLTPNSGLNTIATDGTPSDRPWSFVDPKTVAELEANLQANVPVVGRGPAIAIAMDDEVSMGTFNTPLEVDFSPASRDLFRQWVRTTYRDADQMSMAWNTKGNGAPSFDPATYETVRSQITSLPPSQWRLAPWLDFRSYMDRQQAAMFAHGVAVTNRLAPGVPAGVVGGQQPSAYGGFDYSQLRHALQWIEAYDIGGTNELLRSFWSETPRRGRMQTYFASGNAAVDKWFLWYYLAHGCRAVIAWPDMHDKAWFDAGKLHPHIATLAPTFHEVQEKELRVLTHPNTRSLFSPIAILYSHPSVQVGWAIDASTHGKTWPRRSSSLDNGCLSSGQNRVAWTRLMEDLGHQPRMIDSRDLINGILDQESIRVLVLPQAFAMSERECEVIKRFVKQGGHLITDYAPALTDEHGTGYAVRPLDSLFGIQRGAEQGWFDGKRRYEIDGERYQSPLGERLPHEGCQLDVGMPVVERDLTSVRLENRHGEGSTLYMNLSPTAYADNAIRASEFGDVWRGWVSDYLKRAQVSEPVRLRRLDGIRSGVELLRYETAGGDAEVWAIVANPTRQAAIDGPGSGVMLANQPIEIELQWDRACKSLRSLRTGKILATEGSIRLALVPDEAIVLQASF